MDDDLAELYQQTVLEHGRNPRNAGRLAPCTHAADGHNPVCGDWVHISLRVGQGRIEDIRVDAQGCAISVASASMMGELVTGRALGDVRRLEDAFVDMAKDGPPAAARHDVGQELKQLSILAGVHRYPTRVKCATLPWRTLEAALAGGKLASTQTDELEEKAMP